MSFTTLIVAFATLVTLPATDIYLPSLPGMALYFGASEEAMRSSITIFLVGSLASALPLGLASDRYGRKPIFVGAMATFLAATILCATASSFTWFMIGRFFQGAGVISIPVVGFVIIHDIYSKDQAVKVMAWLGAIFSVSPLLAPSLGGLIDVVLGWRWNFYALTALTTISVVLIAVKLPETKPLSSPGSFSLKSIFTSYYTVLSNTTFLLYVSIFAIICCGEFCYLTITPFYFERTLNLSADACGLYISGIGLSYLLGALVSSQAIQRFGVHGSIAFGIGVALLGGGLLLGVYFLVPEQPLAVTVAIGLYLLGIAVVWGPTATKSLQCFAEQRGTASSIRSLMLTVTFALGSSVGSVLSYVSLLPLALFLIASAISSLLLFQLLDLKQNRAPPLARE